MNNEMTLGYKIGDEDVNIHVGVYDWNAQCALVEEQLHALHLATGGKNEDMPSEAILNAACCVRNMRDNLIKLSDKVDQLIDENMELAKKLEE